MPVTLDHVLRVSFFILSSATTVPSFAITAASSTTTTASSSWSIIQSPPSTLTPIVDQWPGNLLNLNDRPALHRNGALSRIGELPVEAGGARCKLPRKLSLGKCPTWRPYSLTSESCSTRRTRSASSSSSISNACGMERRSQEQVSDTV
ncbi:uncharacterized protein LOC115238498 [Formica exsecta]|uniref:uncharacterized protein LOC115238498 n=1 Tax=Formica exsecta TaxID=72781 RepID=UPI001144BDDD|nr:uncharacterized protein LOC115238498 [Formica exsecta]